MSDRLRTEIVERFVEVVVRQLRASVGVDAVVARVTEIAARLPGSA